MRRIAIAFAAVTAFRVGREPSPEESRNARAEQVKLNRASERNLKTVMTIGLNNRRVSCSMHAHDSREDLK